MLVESKMAGWCVRAWRSAIGTGLLRPEGRRVGVAYLPRASLTGGGLEPSGQCAKSAATVKGLTPFANALDLSIDDLIFGPYFGVPRHRGTLAHSAVNSTAARSARAIKGGACRLRLR